MLALMGAMPAYVDQAAAQGSAVREACTHDAFRLCSNAMPDVARTKACLARNRSSLSPLCRTAFGGRATHARRYHRRHR